MPEIERNESVERLQGEIAMVEQRIEGLRAKPKRVPDLLYPAMSTTISAITGTRAAGRFRTSSPGLVATGTCTL